MFFAVSAGHFNFVPVREHADLLQPLMRPPHDQRDLETYRLLNREHGIGHGERCASESLPRFASVARIIRFTTFGANVSVTMSQPKTVRSRAQYYTIFPRANYDAGCRRPAAG